MNVNCKLVSVNIDASEIPKKKIKQEETAVTHHEEKPKLKKDEKATDDYHFEKFKKQFRRY